MVRPTQLLRPQRAPAPVRPAATVLLLRDAKEAARLMREHLERLESPLSFASTPEAAPDLLALFGS